VAPRLSMSVVPFGLAPSPFKVLALTRAWESSVAFSGPRPLPPDAGRARGWARCRRRTRKPGTHARAEASGLPSGQRRSDHPCSFVCHELLGEATRAVLSEFRARLLRPIWRRMGPGGFRIRNRGDPGDAPPPWPPCSRAPSPYLEGVISASDLARRSLVGLARLLRRIRRVASDTPRVDCGQAV